MDSGNNSGSMQSSSTAGGDVEEYDSRAESSLSLSAFLNRHHPPQPQPPPPATNHVGGVFNHHLNAHHVFDPFSNYLDSVQTSSSPLNLDMVWSRASRSEQNLTDLGSNQAYLLNQFAGAGVPATHQLSMPPENNAASSRGGLNDQAQSNNSNNNNTVRNNPKKRSRASRRAPTTVLTTDTTNFRAMVQEFTGIPAPPFSSSHFSRTRLDLFGSGAATSAAPYLLRPFAQKLQPPPPHPPPQSSIPSTLASTNSTSINYQFSSSQADHLSLLKQQQQQVPLNMQNSFQSILQTPYPLGNSFLFAASKAQPSLEIPPATTVDSHPKMGVLEGLGLMSHAHVNNMVGSSSDGALLSRVNNIINNSNNNMQNPSGDWVQAASNIDGDHHGGVLGSLGGRSSNVPEGALPNGKGSYSASPSDLQGQKGPERAVAARDEGTMESWINCSSE